MKTALTSCLLPPMYPFPPNILISLTLKLETLAHSCPLNNMGLQCAGPLIHSFFNKYAEQYYTVSGWLISDVELWLWRANYKVVWTCMFRGQLPKAFIVQGSTVFECYRST